MESSDQDRQSGGAEPPGQIRRPRELIRLDTDKANDLLFFPTSRRAADSFHGDFLNGFVKEMYLQIDVFSQSLLVYDILGQGCQTVQGV